MITQVCNLSCHGCTNYSDLQHEGYVSWSQGREWLTQWLERVDIPDVGIMGGEPTINPELIDWLYGVRELMPNSQIRFTTNGLLLHKQFELVKHLETIGNCVFKIAVHQDNSELEEVIKEIYDMYPWEPVFEYGVARHRTGNNFRFHVKRPDVFWKTYRGEYKNMMPHNSDPAEAFKQCCQQTCPLLYNGKIYKCSTSGLLADTLGKFNNPNYEQWEPYVYQGIAPDCNDQELQEFLDNFGKPHAMCRMCPTATDIESKIIHFQNVSHRKIKWKSG